MALTETLTVHHVLIDGDGFTRGCGEAHVDLQLSVVETGGVTAVRAVRAEDLYSKRRWNRDQLESLASARGRAQLQAAIEKAIHAYESDDTRHTPCGCALCGERTTRRTE